MFYKSPFGKVSWANLTTRRAIILSIPSTFCVGIQHPQRLYFGRCILVSRNHSTIHSLLLFVANLVPSFRVCHTRNLGALMRYLVTRWVLFANLRLAHIHLFSLYCSFFSCYCPSYVSQFIFLKIKDLTSLNWTN